MKKLSKNLAMYICMLVALFYAMTLKAEAANVTSGTLGTNGGISWTYDADTKTLTLTGEDSGLNGSYETNYESPFVGICRDVEVIILENCTLKGSARYMFADLKYLECVEFINVSTANVTDMANMFENCSSLTDLDVSNFNTGKVTDMYYMFENCSSLTDLDVSSFDTSQVTNFRGMFFNCSSLTGVNVSDFDTSQVTNMCNMFYGCNSLTGLDVSGFDTSQVTDMRNMFSGCSSLSSLDVSKFNTSKVTNMGGMFEDCSSLGSLDVSKFDTSNVTDMSYLFDDCSSLSSLDVSNFDTSKVTNMRYIFKACSGLSRLNVSGFDTSNVTDMSHMFYDCSKLSSLNVSEFDTSNVADMNSMFSGCSNLSNLDVSNFTTGKVTDMYYMFKGCSSLSDLDVSNFDTGEVTDMNGMFFNCSSLTGVNVSDFDTSQVTDMCYMFNGCENLNGLDVSSFDTSQVTNFRGMFSNCHNLTTLDVTGWDTSSGKNMSFMFCACSSLKNLDVSSFDTSKVTDMRLMFTNCSDLTSLNLSSMSVGNASLVDFLEGCDALKLIYTFKDMDELSSVKLPGTFVDTKKKQTAVLTKEFCKATLININNLATGVSVTPTSIELKPGDTKQLQATVTPEQAAMKDVTWKSSNTAVATVDANGKVSAVAEGTATITATAKDGTGVSASCSVTVTDPMSEQERQVRAFVERMYTIVLGRAAEEQGLSDWTARLMAKEIDGATLVDMFVNSDEFVNRNTSDEEYIKILYRAVLGRESDADGLKMWKDMLADDWTRDYILEGLVLSTEFKNICDSYGIIAAFEPTAESQVRSFVKRMYTVVLNRRADTVGLDNWTRQLMNGTVNGAQVADGFINSQEFANRNLSNEKYVKVLYRAFFNREPDEGGFNVWMNELAKGTSRREVMKGFVHSVEFSDLCAQYGIIRGEMQ